MGINVMDYPPSIFQVFGSFMNVNHGVDRFILVFRERMYPDINKTVHFTRRVFADAYCF